MKFDSAEIRNRALRHIQEASKIIDAIDTLEHFFPTDKPAVLPDVEPPPKALAKVNRALLTAPPRPKALPRGELTQRLLDFLYVQKGFISIVRIASALHVDRQNVRATLERLVAQGKCRRQKVRHSGQGGHGFQVQYEAIRSHGRANPSGGQGKKRGRRIPCEICGEPYAEQQMANHMKSHKQKLNGRDNENIQDRDIHIPTV